MKHSTWKYLWCKVCCCCHSTGIQISSNPLPTSGKMATLCISLALALMHFTHNPKKWVITTIHIMKYTPVRTLQHTPCYRYILHIGVCFIRGPHTCFVQCKRFHCCWSIACLSVTCKDGGSVILTWVSQVDYGGGGEVGHCSPTHRVRAIPDVKNVVDEIHRVQNGWHSQESGGSPGEGDTEEAHTGSKANHCTGHIWRRKDKSNREHHSRRSV